jgi:transposase
MMPQEEWMNMRAFKPLVEAGYPWTAIAREAGCDWRTAKKYLTDDSGRPAAYGPRPPVPKLVDGFADVIDEWIRTEPALAATTIHERLTAPPYGFPGSYQRVKLYVARRRPELAPDLNDHEGCFHRRFEVLPGAQAQVDWGDEGSLATSAGEVDVYSFHMVLSYSRDPFCRYTTSMDLATFWAAHRAAFDHFGGVPKSIAYDRTKTVVRNHVGKGEATPAPRGDRLRRSLRFRHPPLRRPETTEQGTGGALRGDHPGEGAGGTGLLLPRGDAGSLAILAAGAPGTDPPHPRRGDRPEGGA